MCVFDDFSSLIECGVDILNLVVPILAGVALVLFMWGGVRYIYTAGEEGHKSGRELLLWGVIALFVVICVYGILRVLDNTFLGGGSFDYSEIEEPGAWDNL